MKDLSIWYVRPFQAVHGGYSTFVYWTYFWKVNSDRCVGADTEFIGKARCKLCIEIRTMCLQYLVRIRSPITCKRITQNYMHPWMLLPSRRFHLAMIFDLLKGSRRKNPHKIENLNFKIRSSGGLLKNRYTRGWHKWPCDWLEWQISEWRTY